MIFKGNGSDAGAASTIATRNETGYVLNGTKSWITNGYESEATVVFATTDKSMKHRGISAFVLPKPIDGMFFKFFFCNFNCFFIIFIFQKHNYDSRKLWSVDLI